MAINIKIKKQPTTKPFLKKRVTLLTQQLVRELNCKATTEIVRQITLRVLILYAFNIDKSVGTKHV